MKPQLPAFSRLSAQKRRMVELRERSYTYAQIAKLIQFEFDGAKLSKGAVSDLFRDGTACDKALLELREHLANEAVKEARRLVRSTYKEAIATLIELSKKPSPPHVRVRAAQTLAQNILSIRELAKADESNDTANTINNEIATIINSALPQSSKGAGI